MREKCKQLFERHKEVILYIVFGVLSTIVSYITLWIPYKLFGVHELISNIISWVCAVSFSYATNAKWVFDAQPKNAKEAIRQIGAFAAGRIATLGVDELIMFVFATWLGFNVLVVKLAAQVVVVILNYIISKLFVFKTEKARHNDND